MPIEKFRTLEEASLALRSVPGSKEHLKRLRFSYSFWSRLRPTVAMQGVRKYRSPEEAAAAEGSSAHPAQIFPGTEH